MHQVGVSDVVDGGPYVVSSVVMPSVDDKDSVPGNDVTALSVIVVVSV